MRACVCDRGFLYRFSPIISLQLYYITTIFFLFKKREPLSFDTGSLAQHFPVQAVSTQKKEGTDRAGGKYRGEVDRKTEICHQSLTLCLLVHEGI